MGGNGCQIMPGICTQGSLKCRKSATWDRQFYFPSEGRRAEDFYRPLKIQTASAEFEPVNLGIRGQHATSAPPKPLESVLILVHENGADKPYEKWRFRCVGKIAKSDYQLGHILSVRLSAWNNSTPARRIFMKFYM
jgi:hypothetical protein